MKSVQANRSVISLLRSAGVECYTRKDWGSYQEKRGAYSRRAKTHPMPSGPAPYHYLHITVTTDTDTVAQGAAGARQVEGYGYSTPPQVSYQDLVTNEGKYYEGQNYGVKGTHTVNDKKIAGYPKDLNLVGYATALMQNVGDAVTDAQVDTVAKIFAARELLGWVKAGAPIHPHRKFAWKSCPGDKAMLRLPEIHKLKEKYVREGLVKPKPIVVRPTPWNRKIDFAHASLKDTASPDQIAALNNRIMRRHNPHMITYTEVQRGDAQAIRVSSPGLGAAKCGGRMLVWKEKRFRLLRAPVWKRLTHEYPAAEAWRDLHVAIYDVEDLSNGAWLRIFVYHLAASVQHGNGWNPDNKRGVAVHNIGWPLLASLMESAEKDGYAVLAVGDGNLDYKNVHWQRYLEKKVSYPNIFAGRVPKRGSHGSTFGRLIDCAFTSLFVRKAVVSKMKKRKPFDHGVIVFTLGLKSYLRQKKKVKK